MQTTTIKINLATNGDGFGLGTSALSSCKTTQAPRVDFHHGTTTLGGFCV